MSLNPVLGKQTKKSEGILDQGSGVNTAILCGHGPQWRDMPDCPGDACEVAGKVWVPEMGAWKGGRGSQAAKSHWRCLSGRLKDGCSSRVTQAAGGDGTEAGFEGPPGIVRGQGGEGGEDLDLDLGGGSEKEGGEQKFQMASFPIKQTRRGGP